MTRAASTAARRDGRVDNSPTIQAGDVHAVIQELDAGPVEMFASSRGAVTALALVADYPDDVVCLAAHEPPLISVLPDAEAAERPAPQFATRKTPRGQMPAWRASSP